jgi:type IV pilus assembly protein PilN
MIRINLMPHRALKRQALQRQFIGVAIGVLVLGVGIWFLVHTLLVDRIENQLDRNKFLEEKIVELDKQIEEIRRLRVQTEQLLARNKVVESLQANRAEVVHLLDELVRQLPMALKGIKQTGRNVALARNNARVDVNGNSNLHTTEASLLRLTGEPK